MRFAVRDFGASMNFDGTDDRVSSNSTTVQNKAGMVLMMWVFPTAVSQYFCSRNGVVDAGDSMRILINSVKSAQVFWENTVAGVPNLSSTGKLELNRWNFVCFIVNNDNTWSWYVNGVMNTAAYTGTLRECNGLQIGRNYVPQYMRGQIAEVRHFNSWAPTKQDLDKIYYADIMPSVAPTLYYRFTPSALTSVVDLSGNGNTGTITGSPNYSKNVPFKSRGQIGQLTHLNRVYPITGEAQVHYYYNNALWKKSTSNNKVLQKSVDGGVTWTNLATFTYNVGGIIVTKDGSVLVSQDADGDYWAGGAVTTANWYRSTDGGATFGGSPVLTYAMGGVASWGMDVKDNTIFVAEYGEYNSLYVYRSTDSGATWSTVFTHPGGSSTIHIHKVHIDKHRPNMVYVSAGDSSAAEGVWYSIDNGDNWTLITGDHQPTWIETTKDYVFFGEDLEGVIHRINKADMLLGTVVIETVYDAQTDERGDFGNLSFYSGATDSFGNVYFGGVAYGESNGSGNNKDAVLVVSPDDGNTWIVLKSYKRNAASSSGPSVMSKETQDKKIFIKNNNPELIEYIFTEEIDKLIKASVAVRRAA